MKRDEITRLFQSLARSLVAQHRQHERERPGGVSDRIGGAELCRRYRRITNLYNYDKMTLKNAVTKGVKAWRDRRVGYWLCIDPKTGEYYLLTSAALAELNGLKAMYRLPAVYYRVVLTRDWNVKLGPHVIGTHLDTSAYIKDLDGFFCPNRGEKQGRIKESNQKTVIFMTFKEAKQCTLKR